MCCGDRKARAVTSSVDYRPIVQRAYSEILGRPADPGGLEHWNAQMQAGWREDQIREAFVRSAEYARNNPGEGPPPDPPPPGDMLPLRVDGADFVTSEGEVLPIQPFIVCCDDPNTPEDEAVARGWPLIDAATIDVLAERDITPARWMVHGRTGPHSHSEPNAVQGYLTVARNDDGGVFDLNQWNPAFWTKLRAIVAHAESRGVYFEVDLIDCWNLDHEVGPWSPQRNVNGVNAGHLGVTRSRPQLVHEAWVRKVVAEVGGYKNVTFQIGNEEHKGVTEEWSLAIRDFVKDECRKRGYGDRLVASNAMKGYDTDYHTFHRPKAELKGERPRLVNEYASIVPGAVLAEVQKAVNNGTAFGYWRGTHSWADTLQTLKGIESIYAGGALPIPAECPPLVKWGSKIHNVMGPNFQPVPSPVRGGFVVVDSTPRFGSGNGKPCNSEHDNCGGRACEPVEGGLWKLEEGNAQVKLQSDGYQARVGPLNPGHYRLRVGPHPGAKDAQEGKPLVINGDVSTVTEWDVA